MRSCTRGSASIRANYALAEGHRALGLRVRTLHAGCMGSEAVTLELFDVRGATLQQVLSLTTMSRGDMCDCGEHHYVDRTVAIAPTRTSGYADLLVRERRTDAADGKKVHDECVFRDRKTQRQVLLHYDGTGYGLPSDLN